MDIRLKVVLGSVSVLAAVLASLQTFFNYSERAQRDRKLGAEYGTIRRRIDVVMALPSDSRGDPKEFLERLEKHMAVLTSEPLQLPEWAQMRAKAKFLFRTFEEGGTEQKNRSASSRFLVHDTWICPLLGFNRTCAK